MKWLIRDLARITPQLRRRLIDATPVGDDFMRDGAKRSAKAEPGKYLGIVLLTETGHVIGWSMLDFFLSQNSEFLRTYIFVKVRHRRKGYGTMIMKKAREVAKRRGKGVRVCPYNRSSRSFFKSANITKLEVAPGYEL